MSSKSAPTRPWSLLYDAGVRAAGLIATAAAVVAWVPARVGVAAEARVGQIRVCGEARSRVRPPRVAPDNRLVFETHEIVVEPLPFGPRISDDPRDDGPVTPEGFRALLPTGELRTCYRWARGRAPALEATLSTVVRIDDWGDVESADVRTEAPGARPVAACIKEVLAGMYLRTVGRPTEVRMQINLARSGLGRPHVARPKAPAPLAAPPGLCPAARAPALLDLGDPVVIDDFDQWQSVVEEYLRECQRKRHEALDCRRDGHSRSCGSTAACGPIPEVVPGGASGMIPDLLFPRPQATAREPGSLSRLLPGGGCASREARRDAALRDVVRPPGVRRGRDPAWRDTHATRSARGLSRGRPTQRLDRSCPSGASCGDDRASPVARAGRRARDGPAATRPAGDSRRDSGAGPRGARRGRR